MKTFSIWFGGRPPAQELEVMRRNASPDFTLIAAENWTGADGFFPIGDAVRDALSDPRVAVLWPTWDPDYGEYRHHSDVLRVWWLMQHPDSAYLDSDCLLKAPLKPGSRVQLPSNHEYLTRLLKANGYELDVGPVRNSIKEFVEIYLIVGAGDASFFDRWLDAWAMRYAHRGGIAEAVIYEPVEVTAIHPDSFFHHGNHHYKSLRVES